jgi:hypothetical protein
MSAECSWKGQRKNDGKTRTGTLLVLSVPRACHSIKRPVGTGCMGAGFVWLDRSECGSERIGREEEGTSSGRAEIGAYAAILRRNPDHRI